MRHGVGIVGGDCLLWGPKDSSGRSAHMTKRPRLCDALDDVAGDSDNDYDDSDMYGDCSLNNSDTAVLASWARAVAGWHPHAGGSDVQDSPARGPPHASLVRLAQRMTREGEECFWDHDDSGDAVTRLAATAARLAVEAAAATCATNAAGPQHFQQPAAVDTLRDVLFWACHLTMAATQAR